ncbi:SDR family NAD(P)-dependent oxidoreductase [Ktedonospora formicarum]|uniref:Beta-ketoacyl-ACP reductase n=1 Tax=Ktedonospora formicarum TaxID=2778364 RepID=A0A8J3I0B9_9CHLR|nr:SDR family NAD(P)-dependent oxidoreductase [Ktedonospora formicarum]GHO43912.1 beta-ketoacyl-ACP reductase [Ktedonospora formicarum]
MTKTAIITGGVKGLGKAMALHLARQGYNLVLTYHTDERAAHDTEQECKKAGASATMLRSNVARKQEVEELFSLASKQYGSIDVLINNAGLNRDKPMLDLEEEDWDQVVDTNMKGTFLCSQYAARYMLEQEHGGSIINIAATTGITGRKNGLNYCASKAGILVMTKCLAMELAPKIRVNCILPGFIQTQEVEERYGTHDPERLRAIVENIPLGRIGQPEEIAQAIDFLLSPGASFINGQKLIIDGGNYMY